MASKYDEVAAKIVELVGGKENVVSLTHCVTRLRFVLKDSKKADLKALSETK
ncbi:MAG: PTS transporter subunit EIIB, partial [Erysipelotrichaceae bacterium]|nr:PTS transporter subunit EIIB [Erysipelotrichaceae bacterium]